jgi:hypothetical protein
MMMQPPDGTTMTACNTCWREEYNELSREKRWQQKFEDAQFG